MSIKCRHSVFGDYLIRDTKTMPANELKEAQIKISDYNALWIRYVNETSSRFGVGGIPTEKGFSEWLNRMIKEVSSGK